MKVRQIIWLEASDNLIIELMARRYGIAPNQMVAALIHVLTSKTIARPLACPQCKIGSFSSHEAAAAHANAKHPKAPWKPHIQLREFLEAIEGFASLRG